VEGVPVEVFEQIIRDYLLRNPEVVGEALKVLERRQQEAETAQVRHVILARRAELLQDPASPVGGNPEGKTTLVEFFDYRCSHCRRAAPTVAEAERQDPTLRVVYKELPILGPASVFAAQAALAARAQGKYLAFHRALMAGEGELSEDRTLEIATAVGLDPERLRRDMAAPAITAIIERNYALADALGIRGTPSFVVGEELIRGAVDLATLKVVIEAARPK
jgi:protein-disulfide isomerase